MTVVIAHRAADQEPGLVELLSLTSWRKLILETVVLLVLTTLLQRWFFGPNGVAGMPHPYWLAVLLASSQYGMSAGVVATVAASLIYWIELSPPSAVQDFYAYAGLAAVQPTVWLATALILGGLRNLHIYQSAELADQLAASRRQANDLSDGLERALAEIKALETRIAVDMSSVAALSRGFSRIDLSGRRAAAESYGEVIRAGTGAMNFTIYLKESGGYIPVYPVEENAVVSTQAPEPLSPRAIATMMTENAQCAVTEIASGPPDLGYQVVRVPPSSFDTEPVAAIVCRLSASQDVRTFRRRAEELSRAFATILSACPRQAFETHR
jgi:hypothetical protein